MKAELVPENGDPPIPIIKDVTVIGRREFCDVRVDDPSLSKRHCVLVKTDGLLVIRDLATTNGTKVKGQRIRWAALLPDDRISLGARKFRIYLGPDDLPSPSERTKRPAGITAPLAAPPRVARPPVVAGFPPPSPLPVASVPPDHDDLEILDDDGVGDGHGSETGDTRWHNLIAGKARPGAEGDPDILIELD